MKIRARRARSRTTEADRPEPGEESRADRTVPLDFGRVLEAVDELDGVVVGGDGAEEERLDTGS